MNTSFVDVLPKLNGYPAKNIADLVPIKSNKIAPADLPGNMRRPNR